MYKLPNPKMFTSERVKQLADVTGHIFDLDGFGVRAAPRPDGRTFEKVVCMFCGKSYVFDPDHGLYFLKIMIEIIVPRRVAGRYGIEAVMEKIELDWNKS